MTTFSDKELIFRHARCCEVGLAELDAVVFDWAR
jgi:hypothetical protein